MKKTVLLSLFALILVSINSCELIDEPEKTPAYIEIDTMSLEIRHILSEGTNSHNIKDAWLFVNNQLIGAFELPMKAPVLEEGEHLIEVFAGIDDNGLLSLPEVYPFYNRYKITQELTAGQTIKLEPNITYDEDTKFAIVEGFESSNVFGADLDGNDNTKIELEPSGRFEGIRSGYIELTDANSIFEAGTIEFYDNLYDANNVTSPIYLELNYKNNMPFEIGVMGFKNNALVDKVYSVGMNPSDEWKKIYINLTLDISRMAADNYQILIRAAKGSDIETGEIFLDNVKLLHF